jgi:hypothetical protein
MSLSFPLSEFRFQANPSFFAVILTVVSPELTC